jgi:hypothetical protein
MIRYALGLLLEKAGQILQIQDELTDVRTQLEYHKQNAARIRELAAKEVEKYTKDSRSWCALCHNGWEEEGIELVKLIRAIPLDSK